MGLETGIWALRLGYEPRDWNLGLETETLGGVGEEVEGEVRAAAQKGIDRPTDQPIKQGVARD